MRFRYTILYVEDVAEAVAFYRGAFGLECTLLHESGDYAEMDTGGTKLAFGSLELMRGLGKKVAAAADAPASFEIAFETDDVEGALERALNCGAELVQGAEAMPWGQTISYVRDLNGFLVELCSPVTGP